MDILQTIMDVAVPIFFGLALLSFIFIWGVYPILEDNAIDDMCKDSGYDKGYFNMFYGTHCEEEDNGTIYKIEMKRCGEDGKRLCKIATNDVLHATGEQK